MDRPFLLAHLSDPHIGADWGGPAPAGSFAAAVTKVLSIAQPDAVLISGDLADDATGDEYQLVRELAAPLQAREDPGALDADQLAWLDAKLTEAPPQPTLVAMHKPACVAFHALVDGELVSHVQPVA